MMLSSLVPLFCLVYKAGAVGQMTRACLTMTPSAEGRTSTLLRVTEMFPNTPNAVSLIAEGSRKNDDWVNKEDTFDEQFRGKSKT